MLVRVAPPPALGSWVVACVVAETIGMTAAAGAARAASNLAEDAVPHTALVGFAVILAGGLVEGTALGLFQSKALSRWLAGRGRACWLLVTLVLAGVGWAAGSAPQTLHPDPVGAGSEPPLLLIMAGASGIGLVMGALLGAAQGAVLRRRVRHPWRWVSANALGWSVAMPVIFAGAGTPSATWPTAVVIATGAATGAMAGAVLGLVTGWFLPTLQGQSLASRVILRLLESPAHAVVGGGLIALEVTGARSGRSFRFPVMVAESSAGQLVVLPGHPERKTWWRNLDAQPELRVLVGGRWRRAEAQMCGPQDPAWPAALATYQKRWSRVPVSPNSPLVQIRLSEHPAHAV
jgi:deazaflavin-dependent oxidoreductase (nitroreductase family)